MVQKIAMLTDKFTYTTVDPTKWDYIGGTPAVANKRLELDAGQGIKSKDLYDFTGSQAYAQVFAQGDDVGFSFTFTTEFGQIGIALKGQILSFTLRNPSTTTEVIPYDAKAHAFWRMRERYGVMFWETSPDGLTWTIQRTTPHNLDLSAGTLLLMNTVGSGFGFGPLSLGFGFGPFGGDVGASAPLPAKVVGGYFAKYKSKNDEGLVRDMEFQDIDPRYGLVYLFQAGPIDADSPTYPRGSGKVDLIHEGGGAFFSPEEWRTGVQFLRKRGTTVLLTVGGGGAYFDLSSRQNTLNFIESVKTIYKKVGGFDGVDFNLETSYAFIAGGRYYNADPDVVPAITVSDDGLIITDVGLFNRTNPNTGAPNLLVDDQLIRLPATIKIQSGAGVGQVRNIVSNTVNTITIDAPFDPPIDGTSYYATSIPLYPNEVVYAAQQFRKIYGSNFSISVPAAAGFFGPFVQHDFDLVDALYRNTDDKGKILLDFLAPQFYDMWYDLPTTTQSARASFVIAQIKAWAARVDNDWQRVGIGNLTVTPTAQSFANSAMSPDACALAYLLVQVDHPQIRGAFHFDIQGDARTMSGEQPREEWEWIEKLYPIINATTLGGNPTVPIPGIANDFTSAGSWSLSGEAMLSGGSLHFLPGAYGDNGQAIYTGSPVSLDQGPSQDGYMQVEVTRFVTLTGDDEAWLDFGFQGATVDDYMYLRIYEGPSGQGFEFHFNRAGDPTPRVSFYPIPVSLVSTRFIRFRKLLSYIFVQYSAGGSDTWHNMAFESQEELIPFTGPLYPFIRNGGQSTSGAWTVAAVNGGTTDLSAPPAAPLKTMTYTGVSLESGHVGDSMIIIGNNIGASATAGLYTGSLSAQYPLTGISYPYSTQVQGSIPSVPPGTYGVYIRRSEDGAIVGLNNVVTVIA